MMNLILSNAFHLKRVSTHMFVVSIFSISNFSLLNFMNFISLRTFVLWFIFILPYGIFLPKLILKTYHGISYELFSSIMYT